MNKPSDHQIARARSLLEESLKLWDDRFDADLPKDQYEAMTIFNRYLEYQIKVRQAFEILGVPGAVEQFKKSAMEIWRRSGRTPVGHTRLLVTAALYEDGYRLPTAGPKDSKMQAAMDAAEIFVRTMDDIGDDPGAGEFEVAFERHYSEKAIEGRDDYETVRKSIQRFKDLARAKPWFALNAHTMQIEEVDIDEVLFGMTNGKGRPKA